MTTQDAGKRPAAGAPEGRGRRLDRQSIVDAGLRLASLPGTESISFRALGAELGVDPTAIYRHFLSKDELMRALLDELHLKVLSQLTDQQDWRDRIRELAERTLEVHIAHPAIAGEAPSLTTGGPGELTTLEYILSALSASGDSDAEVVRHYSLLSAFMLSQTAAMARARAYREGADRNEPAPWLDRKLLVDPGEQPRLSTLYRDLTALRDLDVYRLGIESVLDSAARASR